MKRTIAALTLLAACASSQPAPPDRQPCPDPQLPPTAETPLKQPIPSALRDYFAARDTAEKERALAALDATPVPRGPAERARQLRGALARPMRTGTRFQEDLGDPALPTLVSIPEGYDPTRLYPAVVSLDAMCASASASLGVFVPLDPKDTPSLDWTDGIVIAPEFPIHPILDEFNAENFTHARARVLEAISRANRQFAIDPDRLVIAGLSMGSALAMSMGAWNTDRFAAVAQVSGGCPQHPTPLQNMRTLQLYIMHGDQDTTVDVSVSHENYATLHGKMGVPCVLDIIKGGDHTWPDPATDGLRLNRWLHEQKRNAWPTELDLIIKASQGPRSRIYWIDLPPFPKNNGIKAKVADNVIALDGPGGFPSVVLHLGEPLVDLEREVVVTWKGKEVFRGKVERSWRTLLADLEAEGWDTVLAAPARVEVKLVP
jgi:predicted esterase